MLNETNNFTDPVQSFEEIAETGSTLKDFVSKIFKGDKVIWVVFIILWMISLIEIFSATSTIVYRQQNQWDPILRHAMFLIGGVGGLFYSFTTSLTVFFHY